MFRIPTSHVCEFLGAALDIVAVLGLDGVLNSTGHWVIDTQDGALHQLDLTGGISAKTAAAASSSGCLSLAPGLSGRGLAASVGRSNTSRDAECRCWAVRLTGVRVVVSWRRVRGVSLGQTVARARANRRLAAGVRVVERRRKGALLVREQSARRILVFGVLGDVSWCPACRLLLLRIPGKREHLADGRRRND